MFVDFLSMKSHLLKNRSAVAVIYCFLNLTTETEDCIKVETLYRRQIKSVTTFFLVVILLLHILKSAERSTLRILSSCENSVDIVDSTWCLTTYCGRLVCTQTLLFTPPHSSPSR